MKKLKNEKELVKAAIAAHQGNPVQPLVWEGPFVLEKRFFHSDAADAEAARPDVERVDSQTVRLRTDDIRDIIYA